MKAFLNHESVQSGLSYSTSAGGFFAAHYAEATAIAQDATIFIALAVGLVRLAYDVTRFMRYLKHKGKNE